MHTTPVNDRDFYAEPVITDTDFPTKPQIEIPFSATGIILINDSENETVTYSFRRPAVHGTLLCTDGAITRDGTSRARIWFKASGPAKVRVMAWRI